MLSDAGSQYSYADKTSGVKTEMRQVTALEQLINSINYGTMVYEFVITINKRLLFQLRACCQRSSHIVLWLTVWYENSTYLFEEFEMKMKWNINQEHSLIPSILRINKRLLLYGWYMNYEQILLFLGCIIRIHCVFGFWYQKIIKLTQ